jgi:hypothetical protein
MVIMAEKWVKLKDLKNEKISKELNPIYKYANCTNCPSDWFFPPDGKGGRISISPGSNLYNAFKTCNECKVKQECFNFAKEYDCVGVWGGRLFTHRKISKIKLKE